MDTGDILTGGSAGGIVAIASHFYNKYMGERRHEKTDDAIGRLAVNVSNTLDRISQFEIYAARHYLTKDDLQPFQKTLDRIDIKIDNLDKKLDGKADK